MAVLPRPIRFGSLALLAFVPRNKRLDILSGDVNCLLRLPIAGIGPFLAGLDTVPWSNRGLIGEIFCMGVIYPVPAAICSLLSKDVEDILVECAGLRTCSESRADP